MSVELYLSALALGALGSAHCVAMCSGVSGLFCAAEKRGTEGFGYVIGYNVGRVLSYGSAGIVMGGAGSAVLARVPIAAPQYVLRAAAALAMILVGLTVSRVVRFPRRVEMLGAQLTRLLKPLANTFLPLRSPVHAMALGLMWGWIPCGLLYAGFALSLTAGSAAAGGVTMLAFAAGTLPAMLLVGGTAQFMKRWMHSPRVRAIAGLLLALSGTLNGLTVLQQVGWITLPGAATPTHCVHE